MELCIQLVIFFMGKQFIQAIFENFMPIIRKIRKRYMLSDLKGNETNKERASPQYIKDFKLLEWGQQGLIKEYLEMVMQFGFITIFVCAFPLAPFFALLNNILELRLDARKLLVQHRRPTAQMVQSIGVWFDIMEKLGKISVVTNGFIIALTSEFIPRTFYRMMISEDGSLTGYVDFTLSKFDPNDMDHDSGSSEAPEFCRYQDYKNSYDDVEKYDFSKYFYHIWFARIAFVVVYQNVDAAIMMLLKISIPDTPAKLKNKIKLENYITKELIIEMERIKGAETRDEEDSTLILANPSHQTV